MCYIEQEFNEYELSVLDKHKRQLYLEKERKEYDRRISWFKRLGHHSSKFIIYDEQEIRPSGIMLARDLNGPLTPREAADLVVGKLHIRYAYRVRPNVGETIISTTRDFCRDILAIDHYYTRGEINSLDNEFGTDVFQYGGGWWGDKMHCRHHFREVLVSTREL